MRPSARRRGPCSRTAAARIPAAANRRSNRRCSVVAMASDDIRPFRVEVPDAVLDDLRDRLARTRWPDQIPGSGWDYGTDLAYLQDLCEHWRTKFDWRAQEERFNRWPHFLTDIDGQQIHFIHARSDNPDALPLIITHGWPGSVAEFLDVIEPLRENFHVVVPSLPGYGWSGPTTEPGWDVQRVAEAWATLMARLGYDRYGAQGGDWGAMVSARLAAIDAEHMIGLHSNMLLAFPDDASGIELTDAGDRRPRGGRRVHEDGRRVPGDPGQEPADARLRPHRFAGRARGLDRREVPRLDRQQRQPRRRGHPRPDPHEPHRLLGDEDDQLVDPSLLRVAAHRTASGRSDEYVTVPTAAAVFPKEIFRIPRAYAETRFNLVRYTRFDRGGHFAALEEPDLLVR